MHRPPARGQRALVLSALALAAVGAAVGAAGPEIEVRARALAPGEPVRFVVTTPGLARVDGAFLGRELAFRDVGAGVWVAWGLVPLDGAPGPATVRVTGKRGDGRPVAAERTLVIEAREFPEEHLRVAPRYVEPPADVRARLDRERERIREIYQLRSDAAAPDDAFVRPVQGEPTSVFGTRRLFNGEPRSPHPGLDLRAAEGTPVVCSGPGRVVLAVDLYYSGNTVIVDHGGGLFTLYAHLSRIDVAEGEVVAGGDRLGLSGATGRVTGPHLHWGAKIGDEPFDPRALLDPELFR